MKPNYEQWAVYQIWPRSFADGNGDGIGDLHGVLAKLDYLKWLGIDAIWFSPLYPSPNADYGYDCADYKNINPEYGDLDLFKKVIDEAHVRDIKIIIDLVLNHTSDQHEWFKQSKVPGSKYHDYYFWRKGRGKDGKKPPNNWLSMFEGNAWEYNEQLGEHYLHVFAKGQPDLNMANPAVREEVKDIMRFWLDLGVDGFREDVITYIAKREGLPNGFPLPIATGYPHYTSLPKVKDYLREFKQEVLEEYQAFTVGEAPMMTTKVAKNYITGDDKVLDVMFHFQHMEADCIMNDWVPTLFRLGKLKKVFKHWQRELHGQAFNANYMENHDHPRVIDKYGSRKYRVQSAKMLAALYILQSGMPFIYQGQEIGMTNIELERLDQFKDVVTFNNYNLAKKFGFSEKFFVKYANRRSRENARTPMQWTGEANAGWATPWFPVNENCSEINVAAAEADPNSILHWYRALLKFRRENPVAIYGQYKPLRTGRKVLAYESEHKGKRLVFVGSFSDKPQRVKVPAGGELVFCSYAAQQEKLQPWECRVYVIND